MREIPFLDMLICIDQEGTLSTTLYRKETAGNSLLRAESAYPVALKRSIPSAQYMRLRRICTDMGEFKKQAGLLQKRFLARESPLSTQEGLPKSC